MNSAPSARPRKSSPKSASRVRQFGAQAAQHVEGGFERGFQGVGDRHVGFVEVPQHADAHAFEAAS
jgi:hypothetical protein